MTKPPVQPGELLLGDFALPHMNTLSATECAELAAHRVLRGELAPWVHAVAAELASELVTLHVYHHAAPSGWRIEFEQTIVCEWDQVFSSPEHISAPSLVLRFHAADSFTTPQIDPCLLYVSPWSGPTPNSHCDAKVVND